MGLVDKLLGRDVKRPSVPPRHSSTRPPERFLPLPEDNFVKVVGESHYQDALRSLVPQCVPGVEGRPSFPAALVPEPDNVHDRHAIAVYASTGKIGYLAREDAARYGRTFEALRGARYDGGSCTGLLNGGDADRPSFGVVLTVAYPEVCEAHLGIPSRRASPHSRRAGSSKSPSGTLRGKHYTSYVEEVKTLRREGHEERADQLLLELVEAVEAEATEEGWGVAPWYYEQLAIIYRKRKDRRAEVAILERYAEAPNGPGPGPEKLRQRLEKARLLARRDDP